MSISWSAAKSAVGSNSNLAKDGYNGYKELYGANSGKLDFKAYWRVWTDDDDGTFNVTVYALGRKANSKGSKNDITLTFYAWGNTYTVSKSGVELNASGGTVTYMGYHTFTGLTTERTSSDSDIGFKIVGASGTADFSGTWTCTKSCNFSSADMTSSLGTKTTTSLDLNINSLTKSRGFSTYANWSYKKSSASSYTRDSRSNISYDSTVTSLSHTFDGLTPCTEYDLKFQLGLRNYNPDTDSSKYVIVFANKFRERTGYTNARVATPPTVQSFTYDGTEKNCLKTSGTGVDTGGTKTATNAGTYIMTATPGSEYNWTSTGVAQSSKQTRSYEWTILAKDIALVSANLESSTYHYEGVPITPSVRVVDQARGVTLTEGRDYTVAYFDNINVGTARAVVTGIGNYTGTQTLTFAILPCLYYGNELITDIRFGDTKIQAIYYGNEVIF